MMVEPDRSALERPGVAALAARLPVRAWVVVWVSFAVANLLTWTYVHSYADTRQCIGHLPDPLFALIPYDGWWYWITQTAYRILTPTLVAAMLAQAVLVRDHRPLLRWGLGMAIMALMRDVTILLIPLCRANVEAGTAAIAAPYMIDLGLFEVPWRMIAANDLVFSGHVGAYVLFVLATRSWPRPARMFLWAFQGVQIVGLIATRGHYTVDIVLAIPCCLMADALALKFLGLLARGRATTDGYKNSITL